MLRLLSILIIILSFNLEKSASGMSVSSSDDPMAVGSGNHPGNPANPTVQQMWNMWRLLFPTHDSIGAPLVWDMETNVVRWVVSWGIDGEDVPEAFSHMFAMRKNSHIPVTKAMAGGDELLSQTRDGLLVGDKILVRLWRALGGSVLVNKAGCALLQPFAGCINQRYYDLPTPPFQITIQKGGKLRYPEYKKLHERVKESIPDIEIIPEESYDNTRQYIDDFKARPAVGVADADGTIVPKHFQPNKGLRSLDARTGRANLALSLVMDPVGTVRNMAIVGGGIKVLQKVAPTVGKFAGKYLVGLDALIMGFDVGYEIYWAHKDPAYFREYALRNRSDQTPGGDVGYLGAVWNSMGDLGGFVRASASLLPESADASRALLGETNVKRILFNVRQGDQKTIVLVDKYGKRTYIRLHLTPDGRWVEEGEE